MMKKMPMFMIHRDLLGPATKGIAAAVTEKMNVFGSINKSN